MFAGTISIVGADPARIEDLVLLVEGGVDDSVILRHLRRWGLERDLEVPDLLALKAAGASVELLEILAGAPGAGGGGGMRAQALPDGQGWLLTNLDSRGRRIGGEVSNSTPFNQVQVALAYDAEPRPRPSGPPRDEPPEIIDIRHEPARRALEREYNRYSGYRWGTPGGYTRYKLLYSRAPYDGFRTWVPPVTLYLRPSALVSTVPVGPYGPILFY